MVFVPGDIEHHWKINAHIEKAPSEDKGILSALLGIEFHFWAEHNGQRNEMFGDCVTMCQLNTLTLEVKEDPQKLFDGLISQTAMTNSLSNLRVFLLQAGTLHQMGPRRIMLPFINLNNFVFDKDIEITD